MTEKKVSISALSLQQKILEIFKEVHRVGKDKTNAHFKYDYVSANKTMETFHVLFAHHGLIMRPKVKSFDLSDAGVCKLIMIYEIIDAESCESLEFEIPSAEKGDKAVFKALTGAIKYFLLQTFMLSTDDDPEAEGEKPVARQKAAPIRTIDKSYAQHPEPEVVQPMARAIPKENPWTWHIEGGAKENSQKGKPLFNFLDNNLRNAVTKDPDKFSKMDLEMIRSALAYPDGLRLARDAYQAVQKLIDASGKIKQDFDDDQIPFN